MKTIVFGSINMDLVVTTPHLPQPGETRTGDSFVTTPGGKGANQAVAAARLGAETIMVGRVGDDAFGTPLLENLTANGVDVTQVVRSPGASSGVALITVSATGENSIVVVPGANGAVDTSDVERLRRVVAANDVVLLQLEVPLPMTLAAAWVAVQRGATVVLDPAPAQAIPDELFALADVLTPNETEAEMLSGVRVVDRVSAENTITALHQRGARQILLKMGASGAIWSDGKMITALPAFSVAAIDTVAAGDACNGGFAAALCDGLPLQESLRRAMACGALATTVRGAQAAMPTLAQLTMLLEN